MPHSLQMGLEQLPFPVPGSPQSRETRQLGPEASPTYWALSHQEHGQDQQTPSQPGGFLTPCSPRPPAHWPPPGSAETQTQVLPLYNTKTPERASEEERGPGPALHYPLPHQVLISSF